MLKKLIAAATVVVAALGFASTAGADLEMNLNGASAQFEFWKAAVPAYLDTLCTDVSTAGGNTDYISTGTGCGADGTITIRYSSINSSYGIGLPCGIAHYSTEKGCSTPGTAPMCADADCTSFSCQPVHVGASDVEMTSFVQTVNQIATFAYDDFNQCASGGSQSLEFINAGCPGILTGIGKSVVVPFGFYASDDVTKWQCTAPAPSGQAYESQGWSCDPAHNGAANGNGFNNPDCVGYYKCGGAFMRCTDETYTDQASCEAAGTCSDPIYTDQATCEANGECSDPQYTTQLDCENATETWTPFVWTPEEWRAVKTCGAVDQQAGILGDTCTQISQCPFDEADTRCEQTLMDNISRLMAIQIFSEENAPWLDRWDQFGPWYPDAGIVRCMRCAGSGTHATFDLHVFQDEATIMRNSVFGRFYHDESSSSLVKCIRDNGWPSGFGATPWAGTDYDGDSRYAVGYADADKILTRTDMTNIHVLKYQGVAPTRANIENNEYNFWAAQTLYWNPTTISANGLDTLLTGLLAAAGNPVFIEGLSPQKRFWTVQDEMSCQKVDSNGAPDEFQFPTVVPDSAPTGKPPVGSPPFPTS